MVFHLLGMMDFTILLLLRRLLGPPSVGIGTIGQRSGVLCDV